MKKGTAALAIALSLLSAAPALAAGGERPPRDEAGQSLEQRKADILARIEERVSLSRKEEACVKAAKSHEELRECREKFRPGPPPRSARRTEGDRRDEGGPPPGGERPPADERGPRGGTPPDADR